MTTIKERIMEAFSNWKNTDNIHIKIEENTVYSIKTYVLGKRNGVMTITHYNRYKDNGNISVWTDCEIGLKEILISPDDHILFRNERKGRSMNIDINCINDLSIS